MCGIAGIFCPANQQIDSNALQSMSESLRTRGPDDQGLWISADKQIGLAHRRLSIIDLSNAAHQPLICKTTGNIIIFNGEIYNYQVLKKQLEQQGIIFESHSDTEVLLKLYQVYGEKMLALLRGMYAFAIWNAKTKVLFLARDPFGIKPLYYAEQQGTFYFSSQVKSLLASKKISTKLSAAGQVGFFLWGHVPEPHTVFTAIKAFPAGYSLTLDSQGKQQWKQYFNFTESFLTAREEPIHEKPETVLKQALQDSMTHHLVADVPVGVFLSAGKDSTTLVGLASERVNLLQTITLGFKEYQDSIKDEMPLAKQVAEYYSTNWISSYLNKNEFLTALPSFWQAMDQPSIDGANTFFISRVAHQHKLKVVLSGLGADELLAGYRDFAMSKKLIQYFSWLKTLPTLGKSIRYALKNFLPAKQASLLEFSSNYADVYLLLRSVFLPWELSKVLPIEIIKTGLQELNTNNELNKSLAQLPDDYARMCALQIQWYMKNQLLRDTDWASMANSLEVRVPFVDIELFKVIASLSASWTPNKNAMCLAVKKPLPTSVLTRHKTGFNIPVAEWITSSKINKSLTKVQNWACHVFEQYSHENLNG
ncbi:MAG: asparagine synthase (glutamine-hydrolyzing) [Gammaproteobacteria bacterium RIFCSPHIGHO2_12_FULL_35_23]|nr:MAG: asparagine synthase (glutamine-hydrolyzing) [Gammaproteobacteria bacterium RIFCSPHIGHO2_12_FULL_35_23]